MSKLRLLGTKFNGGYSYFKWKYYWVTSDSTKTTIIPLVSLV